MPTSPPRVQAPAATAAPPDDWPNWPRIFGIQITPGFKRLPKDPVAGLKFGENAGSPQTLELGVNVTVIILPPGWPVSFTLGASYASSSQKVDSDQTTHTSELGVGVRKTGAYGPLRPFVGAGFALCSVEVKDSYGTMGYETRVGAGSGGFLEAGAAWRIREIVDVGLTVRYSNFWSDKFPTQKAAYWDAGGLFAGLVVGYGP